jgi:hypothetical protein
LVGLNHLTVPLAIRRLRGIVDFKSKSRSPQTGMSAMLGYAEWSKLGSLKRQRDVAGNDQYRGAFEAFACFAVICAGNARFG